MWKPEHPRAARRPSLRYPTDLTDREWALIGPMIPPACCHIFHFLEPIHSNRLVSTTRKAP